MISKMVRVLDFKMGRLKTWSLSWFDIQLYDEVLSERGRGGLVTGPYGGHPFPARHTSSRRSYSSCFIPGLHDKGYSKDELNQLARAMGLLISEMEQKPFEDVLGVFYTETIAGAGQQARGEFYTPPAVSQMMAKISLDVEQINADGRPVSVCDPCSGSGAIILSCAKKLAPHQDLLRATLQDINPVACDMAYINMTLWGIPAQIILGNTLANERRGHWANVHWFRVGEDQRQKHLKVLGLMRDLSADSDEPTTEAGAVDTEPPHEGPHTQLGLF